ncbi:hypothetical protein Y032_0167g111 [Ancylostoma ceylanicum]|uniref:Uncharacterized protein n=1 Tax=Ancylostoma ceylanicum TaxID=53326 RepID=A0A016SW60_9BILA|nr:hypothetical protein Y032_0167g111 [Ancylostoma ceylanicum]
MVWHVGEGRSIKQAFVTNRLCTQSYMSHHVCQPVEHIVANVLIHELSLSSYAYYSKICITNESETLTGFYAASCGTLPLQDRF